MVSDADLIERLESLQGSIDGLRDDTKRRIRLSLRAIVVVGVVGVLGVIVGGVGIKHGIDADNSRKERTVAACQQANQSTNDQRDDDKKTWHFVINYAAAGQPAATRRQAKKAIDGQLDKNAKDRQRDCSPAGLNAFYAPKGTR